MQQVISANNQYTAKVIGTHFGLNSSEINKLLLSIGYMEVSAESGGLSPTEEGFNKGGQKCIHTHDNVWFVKWPESILYDQLLVKAVAKLKGTMKTARSVTTNITVLDFRKKYPANIRTQDGHYVRSKAEALIDDFLFNNGIVHAYEKKLPVKEDLFCDFYLPQGKVWIEYWGYENKPEYLDRKKKKQAIYQKYGVNLIELTEKDIQNLDDVLPQKLLQFGIQLF
jgi:hypothetical protein